MSNCLKKAITSDVVSVHFDPELPVILTCDASDKGLGAVLAHRFSNLVDFKSSYQGRKELQLNPKSSFSHCIRL